MSWLARSIANTLNLEDEEEEEVEEEEEEHDHNENTKEAHNHNDEEHHLVDSSSSPPSPGRGVKEDLSELTKTLTSQFWGVASFLAPPPASEHSQISSSSNPNEPSYPAETTSDQASTEPEVISGIRSDFAEIGGKFRSGISRLSSNIPVSEITKMASSFLQFGSEEDNYDPAIIGGVGVTDEVVAFVRNIAMHPKTWLDFPLLEDEDLDMSDAQQEHALAIERLAPRLAALRIELCPGYMSEGCFWKIYFVLLHPRLDIHDAELLSTPQIVKARALLTQELQNHRKVTSEDDLSKSDISYSKGISNSPHEECPDESLALETSALESVNSRVAADSETEKHPILSTEIQIIDKSVIEEGPVNKNKDQNLLSHSSSNAVKRKDEDDGEDWLKEENLEIVGASGPTISIENEQDVSFSDLEEDDEIEDAPTSYQKVTSSTKDSRDWVQLSRSFADSAKDINSSAIDCAGLEQASVHNPEIKESNDWLDVDDIDVA